MRRRSLTALCALTAAALLAGCGATDELRVSGEFGKLPQVTFPTDPPAATETTVVTRGDGPPVRAGDLVRMHYVVQIARGGRILEQTYRAGSPVALAIGAGQGPPVFDRALLGVPVGSRVALSAPARELVGPEGNPQAGIASGDSLLVVFDVLAAYNGRSSARGRRVAVRAGLPVVVARPGVKPRITIPAGVAAPTALVVQPLLAGEGREVAKGDRIIAQYVGVKYADGEQFDASWDKGSPAQFVIGEGQVIPGWDKGLVGTRVGSRILLVVPPADGYGARGNAQAGIRGTDTLVFVVDILDIA